MAERLVFEALFGAGQDLERFDWKPFRHGVEIARLYGDGASDSAAALLRYAPGAEVPPHEHTGYEHIVVLRGSQHDERARYTEGSVVIHGPGTSHRVASAEGCVVLAIWNAPVRFKEP